MRKVLLLVVLINILTACVAPPQMSRKEWNAVTTREYTGMTSDQIILAGEALFRLAYGNNDLKLNRMHESLLATHNRTSQVGLIFNDTLYHVDSWMLTISPNNSGSRVTIQVNSATSANAPFSENELMPGMPVDGTAIFDLFWARLDYLLGKRDSWMTCELSSDRIRHKIVWGSNLSLCSFPNTQDTKPTSPIFVDR